ncbi:camp-dependent protein kinase catalytic subunit [Entophlyctis luteolus]|nr:camp-dependent protein kinase catalytic subunit [Entophlyctis luteolus]
MSSSKLQAHHVSSSLHASPHSIRKKQPPGAAAVSYTSASANGSPNTSKGSLDARAKPSALAITGKNSASAASITNGGSGSGSARTFSLFRSSRGADASATSLQNVQPPKEASLLRRIMARPASKRAVADVTREVASARISGASASTDSGRQDSQHDSAPAPHAHSVRDFSIKRTLGTGSFGRVHLVKMLSTGSYYALKALTKKDIVRMHQVEHILNEKKILAALDMPFLVGMVASFQDAEHLYFVLEYVQGGELFSFLRKSGRFEAHVARFYAAQVALAFEYLHSRHIVYRDLKPENLLIDSRGHLKITDFGFAKHIKDDLTWTLCGTPDYLAPEIIKAKGYGRSVDWWALGILIYEQWAKMISGFPPFGDDDNIRLFEKITACKLRFPEGFDRKAKELCKCLITPDLSKRYGNLRRGAADVKDHAWFEPIDWDKLVRYDVKAPYIPAISGASDTSNFESYDEDYPEYGSPGHDSFKDLFSNF